MVSQKILIPKHFGSKEIQSKKNVSPKNVGFNQIFGPKGFGSKKFVSKKILVQKKYKPPQKFGPKNVVKIESAIAEIFLI